MGLQEKRVGIFKVPQDNSWVVMESFDHDQDVTISESIESSQENSINSIDSSSSSDLVEDASSSSPSSSKSSSSSTISSLLSSSSSISFSPPNSSTLSNGPLYELSELMVHLPLRRGLSKFYQGKSQSFTSLASVKSCEDLPKKVKPFGKKTMKQCKSFGGDLDVHKLHSPKGIIAKKSRGSSFLSSQMGSFRPAAPMQKNY